MTETPNDAEPTTGGKRDWRAWEASRTKKQRAVHVGDDDWLDYEVVCKHDGVKRNVDLNAYIARRIKAFRRKNPDVPMPSDARPDVES